MNWMREHTHGVKGPGYATPVLARYRLGIKAGGAIAGIRVVPAASACPECLTLAGTTYDPDTAPLIPVASCTSRSGCRCAYAAVMAYELDRWRVDHRPKCSDYADTVLARYKLGARAGGAIGGVRVISAENSCAACQRLDGHIYEAHNAPRIPVAECTTGDGCRCAYAPVLAYSVPGSTPAAAMAERAIS